LRKYAKPRGELNQSDDLLCWRNPARETKNFAVKWSHG